MASAVGRQVLEQPVTPFLALHSAVALLALGDLAGLRSLRAYAGGHSHPTQREVVAPLVDALIDLAAGSHSAGADALGELGPRLVRLGGSDAQREIVEETRIAALIRAARYDEARALLDARLDRRVCRRDESWRSTADKRGG